MSLTRLTNQGEHILVGVLATPSFLPILNILCMDRFISQLAGHKRQTSQGCGNSSCFALALARQRGRIMAVFQTAALPRAGDPQRSSGR